MVLRTLRSKTPLWHLNFFWVKTQSFRRLLQSFCFIQLFLHVSQRAKTKLFQSHLTPVSMILFDCFTIQGLHLNEDPFHSYHPPVTFAPLFFNSQFRSKFHQSNHISGSDPALSNHLPLLWRSKLVRRVTSCIKGKVEGNLLKLDATDMKTHA